MSMEEVIIQEISEIVIKNLKCDDSLNLILRNGFNEYIAQCTSKITIDIKAYLDERYPK